MGLPVNQLSRAVAQSRSHSVTTMNDLLLRAARGEITERPPVWLMRQAGRILPEYRAVRARMGGFKELVETPEFAAEVTIQPVDLLGVDAAIIFSDILVIPQAMGLPYEMIESKGPRFSTPIRSAADVARLRVAKAEEDLSYVLEAIRLTKRELAGRVPLIGFAGAPWTLLAYMVEGSGSKTFSTARRLLAEQPALAHELLHLITESTIDYLRAQVRAGADLIQIFDSWAGILGPDTYREFSLPYLARITAALGDDDEASGHRAVPVTVFALGAWFATAALATLPGIRTVGLDWHHEPSVTRELVGPHITLQGNLDPAALYGSFDSIRKETRRMLSHFQGAPHIANLGHGVYPDTDPDRVRCFVETVKEF